MAVGRQEHMVEHLNRLGTALELRRFSVRLRAEEGQPLSLTVINLAAPVLSESVLAMPHTSGELWFYFPWPAPISPVTEVGAAADRIERVLAEVGRPYRSGNFS